MTEQNLWRGTRPGDPGSDPKLRAGDRDRDAVAENLRIQHAEGRLDTDELQHRIGRCYDAKTLGALSDRQTSDLARDPAGVRGSLGPHRTPIVVSLDRPRLPRERSTMTTPTEITDQIHDPIHRRAQTPLADRRAAGRPDPSTRGGS